MGGALLIMLALVTQGRAVTVTATTESDIVPTPVAMAVGRKNGRNIGIYGDKCNGTADCHIIGGFECNESTKSCTCRHDYTATNHIDKCGPAVGVNETCDFNEQCTDPNSQCHDERCSCMYDMTPLLKDSRLVCTAVNTPPGPLFQGDPAMIVILIGMGLMFIVICVVLRLFSKARWRDNRTIFNTPNPRLMNVSLLRDNKSQERRGSKGSVHPPPSRQPSLSSLRPQSPAAHSQGSRGSRPGSKGSAGSAKSPTPSAKNPANLDPAQSTHKLNTVD